MFTAICVSAAVSCCWDCRRPAVVSDVVSVGVSVVVSSVISVVVSARVCTADDCAAEEARIVGASDQQIQQALESSVSELQVPRWVCCLWHAACVAVFCKY